MASGTSNTRVPSDGGPRPDGEGDAVVIGRIARAAAYGINPLVLPPVLIVVLLSRFGASAAEMAFAGAIASVCFVAIPLGCMYLLVRFSHASHIELPVRHTRTPAFLVAIAAYLVCAFIFLQRGRTVPGLISWIVICYAVNAAGLFLINLRWKISLHVAGAAGFVTFLVLVLLRAGYGGLIPVPNLIVMIGVASIIPLLMWSRVYAGAHTRGEVLAGALYGVVVPALELGMLEHAGFMPW